MLVLDGTSSFSSAMLSVANPPTTPSSGCYWENNKTKSVKLQKNKRYNLKNSHKYNFERNLLFVHHHHAVFKGVSLQPKLSYASAKGFMKRKHVCREGQDAEGKESKTEMRRKLRSFQWLGEFLGSVLAQLMTGAYVSHQVQTYNQPAEEGSDGCNADRKRGRCRQIQSIKLWVHKHKKINKTKIESNLGKAVLREGEQRSRGF